MGLRFCVGLPATMMLAAMPVAAQAQSCQSMRADLSAADRRGQALTEENPGTALVAIGCLATASNQYQQTKNESDAVGTFAVCGAIGCIFTDGYQNCITVGSQIIAYAIRITSLQERIKREC